MDEVQYVPGLVSCVQRIVGRRVQAEQFILTGNHHFSLTDMVSRSLAVRTALLNLFPFSLEELGEKFSYENLICRGFYPAIIDRKLNPDNRKSVLVCTSCEETNRCGHECMPFWSV